MSETPSRPTTLYLGGTRAITKTRYGARIFFDTRDITVGIPLALDGDYEPSLNPWLIGSLRPGDVAVDVGANIGFYTIHFAARVGPSGHVHAFECNPELVALLRDSVEINYFEDRCTIYPVAAMDREGEVRFKQPTKRLGGGSILDVHLADEPCTWIDVPATTLDVQFAAYKHPVRLLHIDAEFAEPAIIAGARKFIDSQPDMIVVLEVLGKNYRDRGDRSLGDALLYLEQTGRTLCIIQDNKPMQVGIDALLDFPIANAAAIPRHLAA